MPTEPKSEARFWCIRDDDDEEIRARLPQHYGTAFILWAHLERLAFQQRTSKVVARLGLLSHLTGLSKRCVQARAQDLARIDFLQVTSRQNTDGNVYELLRGMRMKAGVSDLPVAPESDAAAFPRYGSCLKTLRETGKFPNLTVEALALVARGYPGMLEKNVEEISERARVCAPGAISDPMAWLRRRLSEFEVNHERGLKAQENKEAGHEDSLMRLGPPAGYM